MTTIPPKDTDRLADAVLKQITDEHLVPKARWEFVFRNSFFWTLGAVAVLIGAAAFSATIFDIMNVDWRLASVTRGSFFALFFSVAPFLWVIALLLFTIVGYINIRRTRHGYRYPLTIIVIGAILTSVTLGTALYATGVGNFVEESFGAHVPFYRPVLEQKRTWWLAPQKGFLGGTVVSVTPNESSFVLRDLSGTSWSVDASDLRGADLIVLAHGGKVRVVGVPEAGGGTTTPLFHACFLFPWSPNVNVRALAPSPFLPGTMMHSEISSATPRSDICKGVRPYQQLRALDETGL